MSLVQVQQGEPNKLTSVSLFFTAFGSPEPGAGEKSDQRYPVGEKHPQASHGVVDKKSRSIHGRAGLVGPFGMGRRAAKKIQNILKKVLDKSKTIC